MKQAMVQGTIGVFLVDLAAFGQIEPGLAALLAIVAGIGLVGNAISVAERGNTQPRRLVRQIKMAFPGAAAIAAAIASVSAVALDTVAGVESLLFVLLAMGGGYLVGRVASKVEAKESTS